MKDSVGIVTEEQFQTAVEHAAKRVELRRSRLYTLASAMTFTVSLVALVLAEREVRRMER